MSDRTPYILVVDDEPDGREAVARYLSKSGYNVRCAGDGREALRAVTAQMPDLVILDAMMPQMDGVRFLEVIRSYLRWQKMPVILLTAYEKGSHINNAHALDVRKVFFKAHTDMSELLMSVRECIGSPKEMAFGPGESGSAGYMAAS